MTEQFTDVVTRPAHYNNGSVECIEGIESSFDTPAEFAAYCKGNVMKYLWRYKRKNGTEDLRKAQWYLSRLISTEESNG